jgi:predicted hotdog family 3-hydroxylacyl-ACP dehydratase
LFGSDGVRPAPTAGHVKAHHMPARILRRPHRLEKATANCRQTVKLRPGLLENFALPYSTFCKNRFIELTLAAQQVAAWEGNLQSAD